MTIDFFFLLMIGTIKDPILWILSVIIGSNVLAKSIAKKIMYLFLSGLILGLIRLNIYKSFGENFTTTQTVLLIFITVLFMFLSGIFFYMIFKFFKTNT